MLNEYIWSNYLKAGGKDVVSLFEKNFSEPLSEDYIKAIHSFRIGYCPDERIISEADQQLWDLSADLKDGLCLLDDGEYSIFSALDALYQLIKGNENLSDNNIFSCFSGSIDYFTTALALDIPDLFFPYYFQCNFNILMDIANEFDIPLPPIPVKRDYRARLNYYGLLCETFLAFREQHKMTAFELWAFLYDFAPNYLGGLKSYIISELPPPKSAFFIGCPKESEPLKSNPAAIHCWQCNPETQAGDMIVRYVRTPVCAIDSIWRSVSIGFNDPFFYYYRCTYIARPIATRKISQKELQKDSIWRMLPIIRKNMQGINGVELKPSEYNHLVAMTGADVPLLQFSTPDGEQHFLNEKDVENRLIKPFLLTLGYSESDYTQQLYIEIGNHNHALIPDFVILPTGGKGKKTAFALIEAKHSIPNQKAKEAAHIQTRSYARLLAVKYAAIASKDSFWVYSSRDDFSSTIFEASWEEMNNDDILHCLIKLLGKRK